MEENPKRRRACGAIIRNDTILLVRHQHDGEDCWTLPGGGIEGGESPAAAAIREVHEETGLQCEIIRELFSDSTETCFLLSCGDGQQPVLGKDPEETGHRKPILVGVDWFALNKVADDIQVCKVIAALKKSNV